MKKMILVLSCVTAFCASADSWKDPSTGITWSYFISGNQVFLGKNGSMYNSQAVSTVTKGSIAIPSTLGGYPVKYIYQYAFYNCNGITSITIPDSVCEIWQYAFYNCTGLKSITIPSSVKTIGNYAFQSCYALMSADICEGVEKIGDWAFRYCRELESVSIPSSVTSIGALAFADGGGKTDIRVDNSNANYKFQDGMLLSKDGKTLVECLKNNPKIPSSVTHIGMGSFCGNYITSVAIPEGVTSIGSSAFSGSGELTTVTIPSTIESISEGAFSECSKLTGVTIPSGVKYIEKRAFQNCSGLTSVMFPSTLISIGDGAFYGCSGLTNVAMPSSVTSIGQNAFYGCSGIRSVTVPACVALLSTTFPAAYNNITDVEVCKGMTTVGGFSGCTSLTSVIIPESATSVADNAFYGCTSLTRLTIPQSVKRIGNSVFSGCSSLESVIMPTNVTWIGGGVFNGCSALKSIALPEGTTSVGYQMFRNCGALATVFLPSGVTYVDDTAFTGCNALMDVAVPGWKCKMNFSSVTNLTIVQGTTRIAEGAFQDCALLINVSIPSSVSSVGSSAFEGCSGLKSVTIGSGVTSLGNSAFEGCCALTSVSMPDSVTSVGESAFSGCTALSCVTLSSNLKVIEYEQFKGCSVLVSVTIPEGVGSIGACAFDGCGGLTNLTIPSSVSSIGSYAFRGCTSLGTGVIIVDGCVLCVNGSCPSSIALPENVRLLSDSAFRNCVSLTDITMPDSVTVIGCAAFAGCSALRNLTLPPDINTIGDSTFSDCSSLNSMTIPHGVTSIGSTAFYGCYALYRVMIPSSVERIGWHAFAVYYGGDYGPHEVVTDVGDSDRIRSLLAASGVAFDYTVLVEPSNKIQYCETNGQSNPNPTSVWISKGIVFAPLSDIEGWRFIGWSPVSVDIGHVGDIVATAEWERITNDVQFVYGEHGKAIGLIPATQKVAYGEHPQIPEASADSGWKFVGWWSEESDGCEVTSATVITNDVMFYAHWVADPIPEVKDDATPAEIANALSGSADSKLAENITDATTYGKYREWANNVKVKGGSSPAGAESVKNSSNAWLSFALGSEVLIETAPTDGDLKVDTFEPATESGKFDFTVSVKDIEIGSDAVADNLKKVFGLEGGTTLDAGGLSSATVDISFGTPVDGKVKFTAGPNAKNGDAKTFFMKVKMTP